MTNADVEKRKGNRKKTPKTNHTHTNVHVFQFPIASVHAAGLRTGVQSSSRAVVNKPLRAPARYLCAATVIACASSRAS